MVAVVAIGNDGSTGSSREVIVAVVTWNSLPKEHKWKLLLCFAFIFDFCMDCCVSVGVSSCPL